VISWDFLTQAPQEGMTSGGIFPAIVGTLYLVIGSSLISFPIGIMSGIYMNEYATNGKLIRFGLSRGFEMNAITRCLHVEEEDFT